MTIISSVKSIIRGLSLFIILAGVIQSQSAWGQDSGQPSGKETDFQFSFVPGMSTTDSYSTSHFSFNIIGGYNGAFHGFELGSVFNGNRYDVSGFQLSGVINMNGQQSRGAIISGAVNITGSFSGGILSSGAININRQEAKGVLLSGGINIVGGFSKGLMSAGGMNLAEHAGGVSLAPLNIAEEHTGLQIGVLNIADRQEGTQIGVINVSGKGEGAPIGLLSFVEDGRFNVDVWSSETGFVNGGIRLGTEAIYNVIGAGYNPFYGDNLWQVAYGIGYYQDIGNKGNGMETDLMYYQVNYDGKWTEETSMHIQWRFHYTHAFTEGTGLFTGPSLNLYLADEELSDSHIPYTIYDHSSGSTRLRWWAGWTLGLELF